MCSGAAKAIIDCKAVLCIVVSRDGEGGRLVSKYRPCIPVVIATSNNSVAKQCNGWFAQYACMLGDDVKLNNSLSSGSAVGQALKFARENNLIPPGGGDVVIVAEDDLGRVGLTFTTVKE